MLLSLSLVPSLLMFAGPGAEAGPPAPQQIYGGEDVPSCGWPSVVSVGDVCTGTLIHPRVVLTAAHCVTDGRASEIGFGETRPGLATLAETEVCRRGPGWTGATTQGEDYAYCLLRTAVTDVPIIPVAAGCEQAAIQPGARIMHVGFGVDEDGEAGRKRMLDITVNSISRQQELISGNGTQVICNGDSGGPTFVYLDPALGGDGSWRVAAIHSWAEGADPVNPNCNGVSGSVLASQAIDWIEADSGIDITPCTDGDVWSPTVACGDVTAQPWAASGTYATACAPDGEVVEWVGSCGPPLDATPDQTAPVVALVTPATEIEIDLPVGESTASVDIEIAASDEGWGVQGVELTIRSVSVGQEQVDVRDAWQPWTWNKGLPAGSYELTALATDHAGNVSEPVTVCFGVGQAGCGAVGGEGDGSSTGGDDADVDDSTSGAPSDGDSDDTGVGATEVGDPGTDGDAGAGGTGADGTGAGDADGAGAGDGDGGDPGCGCRARGESGAVWTWMMLIALARLRSRPRGDRT